MERVYFWLDGVAFEGQLVDGVIHYYSPGNTDWQTVPAWNVIFERIQDKTGELLECECCGEQGDEHEIRDDLCETCYHEVSEYERAMEDKYDGMKCGDFD